jgi:UDP-glucose 4-epimerase
MSARSLIATWTANLRSGKAITLTDGGLYGTDFVYVDDVVEAALAATTSSETGAFNIGAGTRTTLSELAATLVDITRADASLVRVNPPSPKPDLGFAGIDITRARTHLAYRPRSLREGLSLYVGGLTAA